MRGARTLTEPTEPAFGPGLSRVGAFVVFEP